MGTKYAWAKLYRATVLETAYQTWHSPPPPREVHRILLETMEVLSTRRTNRSRRR